MTAAAAWNSKHALQPDSPHKQAVRLHMRDAFVVRTTRASLREVKQSVRLTLFGGIRLHVGNREIELKNRKAKALIAYLALTPGMKETRDRLVGLLWSESDETKARASLRQLLHAMRDVFDEGGLAGFSTEKLEVSLDESIFTSDLDCALASVDRGDPLDRLVNQMCITETFLAGYDDVDPSFAYWLGVQRESVRQRLIRVLEAQLSDLSRSIVQTKRIACALFQIDPTHELACQKLMQAYVETGDIAGALVAYKRLWVHLEEDHDIEPCTATQDLVVAIKRGTYRSLLNSSALRDPIAVLSYSEEPELDIFPAM